MRINKLESVTFGELYDRAIEGQIEPGLYFGADGKIGVDVFSSADRDETGIRVAIDESGKAPIITKEDRFDVEIWKDYTFYDRLPFQTVGAIAKEWHPGKAFKGFTSDISVEAILEATPEVIYLYFAYEDGRIGPLIWSHNGGMVDEIRIVDE